VSRLRDDRLKAAADPSRGGVMEKNGWRKAGKKDRETEE
jgi:hypothetical protein